MPAAKKRKASPKKSAAVTPGPEPVYADPAQHAELIALFGEWDGACEAWAAIEPTTPELRAESDRHYAEMRRLSAECRRRLASELPAGVRLQVHPWQAVWHNGSENTYNFDVDRPLYITAKRKGGAR